ncbi:hypothetical protein HYH03_008699 [Edaphochlamys debaryana]|uniref:Uncharacterized protein n=1 Tax=Edaphochlamys debaryana TaxID=47281 RepID=A0A835XZE3_9CHLO|nr:hypothetical protein HYH03_008699 [Edaphochlamys debaryana]|eukprot:KAG2493036.1 hypothetical protein HYH03_008699 [Edaphochlamys debaryana]
MPAGAWSTADAKPRRSDCGGTSASEDSTISCNALALTGCSAARGEVEEPRGDASGDHHCCEWLAPVLASSPSAAVMSASPCPKVGAGRRASRPPLPRGVQVCRLPRVKRFLDLCSLDEGSYE